MSQNYFILHGHFYQPPRENPWSGYIDRQISAAPFSDWNARINEECYAACAYSPIMEGSKVKAVLNCYEHLSFNFGPTLLEWMDKESPDTVTRIIEADRISAVRNFGHGNAIAQVFNHMIMPLASEKDQYTQVIWGLEDFRRRFGRDSEGLWLGETAINEVTAAILVDCGVKFVILSPYQAQSIVVNGQEINVEGGRLPTNCAYRLPTKKGDLAVFFYDGPMASGISFGDLLQNAGYLQGAVQAAFSAQQGDVKLVHTATDGEVYGHHKALGNMALAAFIYQNVQSPAPEFVFSNYGAFLEAYPPQADCSLIPGKDNKGSAWSCAHGVGRWHEDCSCQTGGIDSWNQKWRTPLRDAFDFLRNHIYAAAEKELSPLLKDVWEARNHYHFPHALNSDEAFAAFFKSHQKRALTPEEQRKIIALMEGLRFAMLMYTSCGWFFSDISGIETIQDMLYAQRAYEFFQDFLPKDAYENYLAILDQGQSNISSEGTGKDILLRSVDLIKISPKTLRTYFLWQMVCCHKVFSHSSYSMEILHDQASQMLVRFSTRSESDIYVAVHIEEEGLRCCEYPKRPQGSHFWKEAPQWELMRIADLPFFLRLRSLSRSIFHEINYGHRVQRAEFSLPADAFNGIEDYLSPEETSYLSTFLGLRLSAFAAAAGDGILSPAEVASFHTSISLYRKLSTNKERIIFIAKITAQILTPLLKEAVLKKNSKQLKSVRVILWEIQYDIPRLALLPLQDVVYKAYLVGAGRKDEEFSAEFHAEFQMIQKTLNFCKDQK